MIELPAASSLIDDHPAIIPFPQSAFAFRTPLGLVGIPVSSPNSGFFLPSEPLEQGQRHKQIIETVGCYRSASVAYPHMLTLPGKKQRLPILRPKSTSLDGFAVLTCADFRGISYICYLSV